MPLQNEECGAILLDGFLYIALENDKKYVSDCRETERETLAVTEKKLRKLNRFQLLELLMIQTERCNELEAENQQLRETLTQQKVRLSNLGSMAEVALQVSGILEAAQKAADLYLQAAREQADQIRAEASAQTQKMTETENAYEEA